MLRTRRSGRGRASVALRATEGNRSDGMITKDGRAQEGEVEPEVSTGGQETETGVITVAAKVSIIIVTLVRR